MSGLTQLTLFFACIGGAYLIFRFGHLVPPGGAVAINVVVVLGTVALARHWQKTGRVPRPGPGLVGNLPTPVKVVLAASLVLGLTLPIWVILYFVRLGGQLWR
jgi:hypothetical protein